MLVKQSEFFDVLQRVVDADLMALDTETTGLKPYHDDHLFCIVASDKQNDYYFNFHPDHPECLPREYIRHFLRLSYNVRKYIFMANAKFDMAMLARDGVTNWKAEIHDVLAVQRLIQSDAIKWDLDLVAKYFGYAKSDTVETYIRDNKLWEWVHIPGKKSREKNKFYSKVPFEIMYEYALRDSRITYDIGVRQLEHWAKYWENRAPNAKRLRNPLITERHTTTACFHTERRGILINAEFCQERANYHETRYKLAERAFHDLTGKKLIDSAKTLAPIFNGMGYVLPKTEKGADSITDKWLAKNDSRVSQIVREFREDVKLANTYYKAFLWHRDSAGAIHANIRQGGTRTGRFSYGVPNLQNIPRDGEAKKAFVPREDHVLVSIDYDQQEYRMMLDYAGQTDVIEAVLGGLDVHAATAQMMGVDRTSAKTLNFLLLYGGGVVKLATALFQLEHDDNTLWSVFWLWKGRPDKATVDVPERIRDAVLPYLVKAEELRNKYFAKLPHVSKFIEDVRLAAQKNKLIRTWTGRPIHFRNKQFSYKAPNALIQGGCSDVGKLALIELDRFLLNRKSKVVVLVHDENLFEIHKSELHIVPELKRIMESVYPYRSLPLTCSVSWSEKSWGDLVDGMPIEETGNQIQRESNRAPTTHSECVVS